MTTPSSPAGSSRESFFTSSPARPKIACSSFSSGVSSLLLFGETLPTRMSPGPDARADADDAVLVEVAQGLLGDVGDVAGELLAPELGLADLDLVFLDVDGGEGVVLDQPLGDEDGVLEVVAVEGHERDQHVRGPGPARRCMHAGPSAMIWPFLTCWPFADDGLLVQAGPLVEPGELAQLVLVGVVDDDPLAST